MTSPNDALDSSSPAHNNPPLFGGDVDLTPWRGRVLLLALMGPPWTRSLDALPVLKHFYHRYHPQGLDLVTTVYDLPAEPREVPRALQQELDFRWRFLSPATIAAGWEAEPRVEIPGYPYLLSFDRAGVLRADTWGEDAMYRLEPELHRLMDGAPS